MTALLIEPHAKALRRAVRSGAPEIAVKASHEPIDLGGDWVRWDQQTDGVIDLGGNTYVNGGFLLFECERMHFLRGRIRSGNEGRADLNAFVVNASSQIVAENLSLELAPDQNASACAYDNTEKWAKDVTFRHCVFAWGHREGPGMPSLGHSMGVLVAGRFDRVAFHECLFAYNQDRNPRITAESYYVPANYVSRAGVYGSVVYKGERQAYFGTLGEKVRLVADCIGTTFLHAEVPTQPAIVLEGGVGLYLQDCATRARLNSGAPYDQALVGIGYGSELTPEQALLGYFLATPVGLAAALPRAQSAQNVMRYAGCRPLDETDQGLFDEVAEALAMERDRG